MTYQELYDKLLNDYTKKSEFFLAIDKKITQTKGFGDIKDLDEYFKARNEWQIASNTYWIFLSWTKGKNINPNDEIDNSVLYS